MKELRIRQVKNNCKYHREEGAVYGVKDLVPPGICLAAFSMCYPYCLSLLYDAKFSWMKKTEPDAVYAQCPTGKIAMKIERIVLDDDSLRNEWKNKIVMTVIEDREGQSMETCCEKECIMSLGDEVEFPKGAEPVFCPAAFNQIYPIVNRLMVNSDTKIEKPLVVECPDHNTRITFEVFFDEV